MAIRHKLTIAQVMEIKRMGREAGLTLAKVKYPELDNDDLQELEKLWSNVQSTPATIEPTFDPHRRTFIAVAWLLGASLRQLGRKYSVTPQTIMQQLDRQMGDVPDRSRVRLVQPPLEAWKLNALHELFYQMATASQPPFYSNMPLMQVAAAMHQAPLDTTKFQPDESEAAYGDLPSVERRIGEVT